MGAICYLRYRSYFFRFSTGGGVTGLDNVFRTYELI